MALLFQSTRPRGARPGRRPSPCARRCVSIHAPARGATRRINAGAPEVIEFQSTRPRGARPNEVTAKRDSECFNPRARAGRDVGPMATSAWHGFNPRARAGRDWLMAAHSVASEFQSTRPRGARPVIAHEYASAERFGFNPRARAGRDDAALAAQCAVTHEFQSTRPRGARPMGESPSRLARSLFQSTRPRGARHAQVAGDLVKCLVSIHAPARGATRAQWREHRRQTVFQSTRPRGARLLVERGCARSAHVSIHAPARGATVLPVPGAPGNKRFNPRARAGRDSSACDPTAPTKVSIHAPARGAT